MNVLMKFGSKQMEREGMVERWTEASFPGEQPQMAGQVINCMGHYNVLQCHLQRRYAPLEIGLCPLVSRMAPQRLEKCPTNHWSRDTGLGLRVNVLGRCGSLRN